MVNMRQILNVDLHENHTHVSTHKYTDENEYVRLVYSEPHPKWYIFLTVFNNLLFIVFIRRTVCSNVLQSAE